MNLRALTHQLVHYGLIWGATLAFALFLLVSGILIRLYYKPYNLEEYMPAIHQILYLENIGGIEFDTLELSFDGRLNLEGEGVLVLGPDRKMLATARQLRLELSHISLLEGVVAFKLLEFDGLGARFLVSENGVQVGQHVFPRGSDLNLSALGDLMTKVRQKRALKYLEVVSFRNTLAHISVDGEKETYGWDITSTDLLFTQNRSLGAHAELTGVLKRGEDATSFYGSFEKPRGSESARLTTRVGELESRLFAPLLPEKFRERLTSTLKTINLRARLDDDLSLTEASLSTRLGQTRLNLPGVYPEGLQLHSANLGFTYLPAMPGEQQKQQIQIDDFVIEDHQGLIMSGQGGLTFPRESDAIQADTIFKVQAAKLAQVMAYLPPKQTKDLIKWLREATNYQEAQLSGITLNIKGDLRAFPFDYSEANEKIGLMEAHFDYSGLDMVLHPKLPVLEQISGQAVLQGDVMRIVSPEGGIMNDQTMADIDVIISNIIVAGTAPVLRGTGAVTGPAQGMLPLVAQLFDTQPMLDEIEGRQTSKVDLVFPLTGKEEDLQFSVKTEVTDTAFELPHIGKPFQAEKLFVETTDEKLTVRSSGKVRLLAEAETPWPAELLWQENMKNLGAETFIEATLTTIDNPAPAVLANLKTDISGRIVHNLTLRRNTDRQDWFDVTINSDLTPAQVNVKSFDWQKPADTKGEFRVEGRLHRNGRIYDAEMILLDAPEAEILGAAYLSLDDNMTTEDFALNLSPFKLGKTNASVIYQDETFSLTGELFNFTGIGQGRLHEDMQLADGSYEFDLDKLIFRGGEFHDIKGFLLRDNNRWDEAHVNAKVGTDNSDFTMLLSDGETRDDGHTPKHLEVFSGNAGAAVRALGVYENLHKGKMEVFMKIDREYSPFGFDATGHALVENTFVRNAPAMVRLLSLVSLEQIMSANQGIAFNEMKFPLEMQDRKLFIKDGRMEGPNIAMKLAGMVDFKNNTLELDGSLTPASGLNSVLARVPVFGALLTGTQGAMMVADFGIEGPASEPEVWANPLSIVTPGILKDIFGGIFGGGTPSPERPEPDPETQEDIPYEKNIFSQ